MRNSIKSALAVAAVATTLAPLPALAQSCITESEVSAMARYSVPAIVQSANARCVGQTGSNYFPNGASSLAARYAAQRNTAWPMAKSGLMKFAAQDDAQDMRMMANLPDEAVRPFIDAMLVEVISQKMPMENCGKVEKLMRALEPLEPEELGTLIGAILSVVELEDLQICDQ